MHRAPRRAVFALSLFAAACSGKLGHRHAEKISTSYPLGPEVTRLVVEVPLGSITVLAAEGEDDDRVAFEGEGLRAADDAAGLARLASVELTLLPEVAGDVLTLRCPPLPPGVARDTVQIVVRGVVRCPARLGLTVDTGGGSVRARGLEGGVAVETGRGTVHVSHCRGRAMVANEQGDVLVDAHRGGLHLRAPAGSIRVFLDELGAEGIDAGAQAVLEVHLPRDASFEVDARVERGRCFNSFGVPIVVEGTSCRMAGAVLGGGARVALAAVLGPITVATNH